LLNGKAGLSGEMALRIEKAFGVRMDTLVLMRLRRRGSGRNGFGWGGFSGRLEGVAKVVIPR
jgi:hypothetical protein